MTIFENGSYRAMYYAGRVKISDVVRQGRTAFCTVTPTGGRPQRAEIRHSLNRRDEVCSFTGRDGLYYLVSSSDKERIK